VSSFIKSPNKTSYLNKLVKKAVTYCSRSF